MMKWSVLLESSPSFSNNFTFRLDFRLFKALMRLKQAKRDKKSMERAKFEAKTCS